jgi:hypothetical protein
MSEAAVVFKTFLFEHGGKRYELRRPSLGTERAFAIYLEREDTKWAIRQKAISAEAYRDGLSLAREASAANEYGWCRPGFFRALSDVEHTSQFFWYWFAQCFPEGSDLFVPSVKAMREIYVAQKAGHEPGDSPLDRIIGEALTDPNPLPPA